MAAGVAVPLRLVGSVDVSTPGEATTSVGGLTTVVGSGSEVRAGAVELSTLGGGFLAAPTATLFSVRTIVVVFVVVTFPSSSTSSTNLTITSPCSDFFLWYSS